VSRVEDLSLEQSLLSTGEGLQKVNENFEIFFVCFDVVTLPAASSPTSVMVRFYEFN